MVDHLGSSNSQTPGCHGPSTDPRRHKRPPASGPSTGGGTPSFSGPTPGSSANSRTSGAQPAIPSWQGASLAGNSHSGTASPLDTSLSGQGSQSSPPGQSDKFTAGASGPAAGQTSIVEDVSNEDDMCVICLSAPATAGFLHGTSVHKCCCADCAADMSSQSLCPVCREPIQHVILKIY